MYIYIYIHILTIVIESESFNSIIESESMGAASPRRSGDSESVLIFVNKHTV